MADVPSEEIARILGEAREGDPTALERLFPLIYRELRAMAGGMFRQQAPDHTLQPTAVVHEAYVKLVNSKSAEWKDRAHFFAVAAKVMRNLLIDHAQKGADRRGGDWDRVTLDMVLDSAHKRAIDVLDLDQALTKMAAMNERMAQVVELRFFGGLTVRETAEALGISTSTVDEDWAFAKAWLTRWLNGEGGGAAEAR